MQAGAGSLGPRSVQDQAVGCREQHLEKDEEVEDVAGQESAVHPHQQQQEQRVKARPRPVRSEEHTSELQSLMRISYAVFCLKKKTTTTRQKSVTRCKSNKQ